jgi:hypothetical protein
MSSLGSALVDVDALWKILLAGFAGGAGVVVAFGLVLIGRSRYAEARDGGILTRGGYLLVAMLGAAFCAAALVAGFLAMTKK